MKIGFICPNTPGHLNPMTALARHLQARNHEVVFLYSPNESGPRMPGTTEASRSGLPSPTRPMAYRSSIVRYRNPVRGLLPARISVGASRSEPSVVSSDHLCTKEPR
jgi:hypothetical protein